MKRILKIICAIVGALAILAGAIWGLGRAITGSWDVRDWGKPDIEQPDNSEATDGGFYIEPNDSGAVAFSITPLSAIGANHIHSNACFGGCLQCQIMNCSICYPNTGTGGHIHNDLCTLAIGGCSNCKAIGCEICYPSGTIDPPVIDPSIPEKPAHNHNDNCTSGLKVCSRCLEIGCEICEAENQARNNLSVTATVNPSYVTFKTLYLSIHWDSDEGFEDSDVYGEDVNDYVRLSKTTVESGEAFIVTRLKPFDCPIVLEADNRGGAKGDCAVHSVATVETVAVGNGIVDSLYELTFDYYLDNILWEDINFCVNYGYGSKSDRIDFNNHFAVVSLSLIDDLGFDLSDCNDACEIAECKSEDLIDGSSYSSYTSAVVPYISPFGDWQNFFGDCLGLEIDPNGENFDGERYTAVYNAFAEKYNSGVAVFKLSFSFFGEVSGKEYVYSFDLKFNPEGMIVGGDVNIGDVDFV
ncbi:MAG: hypothetical protein K2N47_03145 [Clostridia bacterium]|nr:hypothetical protein [Clostridia bacterium]